MLNDAMVAAFYPFRTDEGLKTYVRTLAPRFREPVSSRIDTIGAEACAFVADWPERIGLETGFEPVFAKLLADLRSRHPWMSTKAEKALESYIAWIVWHEGF